MKNKKTIIIVFSLIILVFVGFFATLYYVTSTKNDYSFAEKKWINDNKNSSYDVYIDPNLPVFSKNGKGVYYEFINALKEDTSLSINISNTIDAKIKLINKNSVSKDDVVFYKDHFILIGNDDSILDTKDLEQKNLGVIKSDSKQVKFYLTEHSGVKITEYNTFEDLKSAYDTKEIFYMVIPMYKYMNEIIQNDYSILLHFDGLYSYYTLILPSDDDKLSGVFKKFYNRWEETSNKKRNSYLLDSYYSIKNFSELEKEGITNDDIIVGYIENLPFEGMVRKNFTGLTDTYLSKFSDITSVTYKYIKYKDIDELKGALNNKEIDLVLNYYSLGDANYINSQTLGSTKYVVLAHINNNIVVNSLYSLINSDVNMLSNMNLKYNMASKNLFEISEYKNVEELVKSVDNNSIIIIEKEVYDYYKDSKLKNYSIRFIDNIRLNNSFLLKESKKSFNKLFNFYLTTISSNEVKNESVVGVLNTLRSNRIFNFIMNNIVYIILLILCLIVLSYVIIKRKLYVKKIRKEDRLYYFDAMTNLKNRNYLNDNIEIWSSTKVYPQAIIVIDINSLKSINDKYGHEAGDNQIKAVAGVLIKTQKDNTEIIRTDGDEFIVYMVGYDEKKVGSYIHKLNKEMLSTLPNKDKGISIGYCMINSEQTTIDDAINDSLIMISKNKGK